MIAEQNGLDEKSKAKAKAKIKIKGAVVQKKLTTKVMGVSKKGSAKPTPFITAKT